MTNYEFLKNCDSEEFAEFLLEKASEPCCFCIYQDDTRYECVKNAVEFGIHCKYGVEEWLSFNLEIIQHKSIHDMAAWFEQNFIEVCELLPPIENRTLRWLQAERKDAHASA